MIEPFTYDGETYHIRDNIGLVQALERCAAAYRNRCLSLCQDHPNPMWVRLYAASERLRQAVLQNDVPREILEIGSSLMGCDGMAILELHGPATLCLLSSSGMTAARRQGSDCEYRSGRIGNCERPNLPCEHRYALQPVVVGTRDHRFRSRVARRQSERRDYFLPVSSRAKRP